MKNIPTTNYAQGFVNSGHSVYTSSLNVGSSNISLSPGDMLITTTLYPYYGVTDPNTGERNYTDIQEAAILTVLASAPAYGAESFRPGLRDSSRTIYNAGSINYSLLQNVAAVSGAPSLATVTDLFSRPWLDFYQGQVGRSIHPNYNMRDYGAELAADIGNAALLVNTNLTNTQKKPLVVGIIQQGLDWWGSVKNKYSFYSQVPAHILGRKFPIMFAGNLLNISEIKAVWPYTGSYLHNGSWAIPSDARVFSEDQAIEYVTAKDVSVTATGDSYYNPEYNYTSAMVGMPEFFHYDYTYRWKGNPGWNVDSYRYFGSVLYGVETAVSLMGWKSQWNNQAFFDYMERHVDLCRGQPYSSGTTKVDPFGYTVPYNTSGFSNSNHICW